MRSIGWKYLHTLGTRRMKQKDINNLSSRPRIIYGGHERKQTHGKQAWRIAVVRELAFHQCDLSSDKMWSVHGSFSLAPRAVFLQLHRFRHVFKNSKFQILLGHLKQWRLITIIHFGLSFMCKFGNPSEVKLTKTLFCIAVVKWCHRAITMAYGAFSHDVTPAILVFQDNEMAAIGAPNQ